MTAAGRDYPQSYHGLLAILSLGPQTGYDIRKVLEAPEIFYWKESYGNIYPMLRKLERDGLVNKRESWVKKKKRVVYELNTEGWKELDAWLSLPASLSRFRVEVLMKLRFGESAGIGKLMEQVRTYGETAEREVNEALALAEGIEGTGRVLQSDLRLITLKYFISMKKSNVEWSREALGILEKWKDIETDPADGLNDVPDGISVIQVPEREPPLIE